MVASSGTSHSHRLILSGFSCQPLCSAQRSELLSVTVCVRGPLISSLLLGTRAQVSEPPRVPWLPSVTAQAGPVSLLTAHLGRVLITSLSPSARTAHGPPQAPPISRKGRGDRGALFLPLPEKRKLSPNSVQAGQTYFVYLLLVLLSSFEGGEREAGTTVREKDIL